MVLGNDQPPRETEIRRQLQKILASDRFVRSPRHSEFLELIVSTLLSPQIDANGRPLGATEEFIRQTLFPERDPANADNDSIVRTTASELRKRLEDYYLNEGREDPIKIDMPKGRYTPTFTRNTFSEPARLCREALSLLKVNFPYNLRPAREIVETAIKHYPTYGRSYAFLAQLFLEASSCNVYFSFEHPTEIFHSIEQCITKALTFDDSFWLSHVVHGAFRCCHFQWDLAAESFGTALKLDRQETRNHWFYAAYLLATGNKEQAVTLMCQQATRLRKTNNAPASYGHAQALYALFLYATRQYGEAIHELDWAKSYDKTLYSQRDPPSLLLDVLDYCSTLGVFTDSKSPDFPKAGYIDQSSAMIYRSIIGYDLMGNPQSQLQ
jgi:Tfp pilus assembly protein PilF